ncbi:MAG: phosphoribosylanthranilate isomerase [Candidatus Bathyarchaeia archaeon]
MISPVKVKVCGITRREDVQAAAEAGVDAVGFIVGVPSSPRNLPLEEAKALIREAPVSVVKVLVTVPKDLDATARCLEASGADALQVHGLTPGEAREVRKAFPEARLIGVFHVDSAGKVASLREASECFDAVVTDTFTSGQHGGTGLTHDWGLSRQLRDAIYPKPLILAGGLTPENVAEAARVVRPYAVDVSSGVEASPGVKDREKLFRFVANARRVKAWS